MSDEAGAAWAEQDTTPSKIEAALRKLLQEQHAESEGSVPARVLNLVVVVEREWRGEIYNRLEGVGRYHPSRTILCAVDPARDSIDAQVTMSAEGESKAGEFTLLRERVVLDLAPQHLANLDTIVDALVVPDLATVVWSPHGHPEAVNAVLDLAQVVLIDSVQEPDLATAVGRARELAEEAYIVDLAWLRSTPWRERIAATFDPPVWRQELRRISSVTIRHSPESGVAGLLLFGWLCSRLGWDAGSVLSQNGTMTGRARGARQEVKLTLEPNPQQTVPGLAGLTVETASGMSISLDRGEGGLHARRCDRKGRTTDWTVLGASRGEAGILGEGIRQALLRDPTYRPSLAAAEQMLR